MFKSFTTAIVGAALLAVAFVALTRAEPASGEDPGLRINSEPVLVELFTSQGCSSCPPADQLAARLETQDHLVVVSRPVTYWDRLGWKDTLALESNTDQQRRYAWLGLAGRNGVYTPQMVVNGSLGAVGSHEKLVNKFVHQASQNQTAAIRSKLQSDGSYQIGLGGETNTATELVLMALTSRAEVSIGRGENTGRTISYTNVLRSTRKLADWNGGKQSLTVPASALQASGVDRYALVLKEAATGRVLAARYLVS